MLKLCQTTCLNHRGKENNKQLASSSGLLLLHWGANLKPKTAWVKQGDQKNLPLKPFQPCQHRCIQNRTNGCHSGMQSVPQ